MKQAQVQGDLPTVAQGLNPVLKKAATGKKLNIKRSFQFGVTGAAYGQAGAVFQNHGMRVFFVGFDFGYLLQLQNV